MASVHSKKKKKKTRMGAPDPGPPGGGGTTTAAAMRKRKSTKDDRTRRIFCHCGERTVEKNKGFLTCGQLHDCGFKWVYLWH
jgi:hypothetical protein